MIKELSRRSKHLCIAFLLALSCGASAAQLKVVQISANPHAYHRQKVSVMGVAFVQGKSFILFQDPRAAKEYAGPPKSLPVTPRDDAPDMQKNEIRTTLGEDHSDVDANRLWVAFPCE